MKVKKIKPNSYYKWKFRSSKITHVIYTDYKWAYNIGYILNKRFHKYDNNTDLIEEFNINTSAIIIEELSYSEFLLEQL